MNNYYLVRGADPAGGDRIEIAAEMIVGRSEDCDLRVQEGHPSRRHARLVVDGDGLWVEDLGSANGTLVNDRLITERTRLRHGDRVAFDLSTFVAVIPAPAADSDATVVRRVDVSSDATVVRPAASNPPPPPVSAPPSPPPAASAPTESPPAPAPAEKPAKPAPPASAPAASAPAASPPAAAPTGKTVPKSWADPDFQPEGTRVLTPEELKAIVSGASAPTTAGPMVDGPHLRVVNGNAAGSVLSLASGTEWTIGSDDNRDLRLNDSGISGFHAKISHEGGRWRIIDQMSANGTFVNGDKATVSYLKHGDRIRVAQVECELNLPAAGARGRSQRAAAGSGNRTWLIVAIVAVVTVAALAAAALLL
jgi:pSer/pThr/pTyr-binding forkhead associated (FHA) protein